MRHLVYLLFFWLSLVKVWAHAPESSFTTEFIQNSGQWDEKALFTATLPQGWLFLEKAGFTYNFLEKDYFDTEADETENKKNVYRGHGLRVQLINANPQTKISGQQKLSGLRNYFIGNNPAQWAKAVPAYGEILYSGIFPGINLRLYTAKKGLKYDYVVAAGANIDHIKMKYEGAQKLTLQNGRLYIKTSLSEIIEEKPFAYQEIAGERKEVGCEFTLQAGTLGFKITGNHRPDLPLIIDPELIFMTYAGANAGLSANCATADAAGNTYISSRTMGPFYPVSTGAYQTVRRGNNTGISKLNEQGTGLLYATYLGGSGVNNDEYPLALVVNRQNELYILGHTTAEDFPTTGSAYDRSYNGNRDYFIARLSANGTALLASTYLGGAGPEGGTIGSIPAQLALDDAGNIFVGGCTMSNDFRIVNGFQTTKKNGYDGLVAKLNNNLTNLLWSSFIGGNSEDLIYDLKIGVTGKIYLGGSSFSSDFPVTPGTIQTNLAGNRDGFIAIISANGTQLEMATFLGTPQADFVKHLQLDKTENVYATGYTAGSYPITTGTYGTPNASGGYFIHKLSPTLNTTIFSTHLGANGNILKVPTAFRVNTCETIYLAGYALNVSPLTADAQERNRKTMYVCQLSKDAKQLIYGSYLGGTDVQTHIHQANNSLITEGGTLHQIECTYSSNQPVTPGAYDPTYFSSPDAAIIKYQFSPYISNQIIARADTPPPSCAPYNVQFKNTSENGVTYSWNFGDGSPPSTEANPSHTYQKPGNYQVTLAANNSTSCITQATTTLTVTVAAPPAPSLARQSQYLCSQTVVLNAGNPGYNYLWSTGSTEQSITVTQPGTYAVALTLGNCTLTDSVTVAAALPALEVPNIFTPNKDGKNDFFVIQNSGPNTELQVYNRWGKLVYENKNYLNNWDGSNLTQGTYYYFIRSASNCTTKKGWLEINE